MRISDWSSDVCSSDLLEESEPASHLASPNPKSRTWTDMFMNSYQLRQTIRAAWHEPYNPQYAMILKVPERFEAIASLRTFATELGARAIVLDIEGELSADQILQLKRKGPRIAIIIRSEEHTSELQSLMRTSYAVF